jgi:Zn-dependent protease with chaperone function
MNPRVDADICGSFGEDPRLHLQRWATERGRARRLACEVHVQAWAALGSRVIEPDTRFISAVPVPLAVVCLCRGLVADPSVSLDVLKAVVAHELGHVRVGYDDPDWQLPAWDREFRADMLSAEELGPEVAITALREVSAWDEARGEPWSKASFSHPSLEDRIANLEAWARANR